MVWLKSAADSQWWPHPEHWTTAAQSRRELAEVVRVMSPADPEHRVIAALRHREMAVMVRLKSMADRLWWPHPEHWMTAARSRRELTVQIEPMHGLENR